MADELPPLPSDWGIYQSTTRYEMKMLRRRNWFVRMADAHGLVPDATQTNGVAALMIALEPEVFPSKEVAYRFHRRRPWHVVEQYWGTKVQAVLAKLPGEAIWLSLLVHSPTVPTGLKRAATALPKGTDVKEPDT